MQRIEQTHTKIERPKWIAIGKQQNRLQTKSLLHPIRKRYLSNSHSEVTDVTFNSLVKMRSAKDLISRQTAGQENPSSLSPVAGGGEGQRISINIIFKPDKKGVDRFINKLKRSQSKQQQIKPLHRMNYNHVPFYMRNQENKVHFQKQSSQRSADEADFDHDANESVVLMIEEMQSDHHKPELSHNNSSNILDNQSEIIEETDFMSEANNSEKPQIRAPIVHYEQGYRNQSPNNLKKNSNRGSSNDLLKQRQFQEKVKLRLNQLSQMAEHLKIIQATILQEISTCQATGKIPLFLKNQHILQSLVYGFRQIMNQQIKAHVQKEVQRSSQTMNKLLSPFLERGLLDSSPKEMDASKKVQRVIRLFEQKDSQISQLRSKLAHAQTQYDTTSSVLYTKLQQINSMKEELSRLRQNERRQNEKSTTSMTSQHTATFSPQFEKLLREKETRGSQMVKEIEQMRLRNQQLMDEKEKLQEEVFTLQQKIIGVEMEVQQKVRQEMQEIRAVIEEQVRAEYQAEEKKNNDVIGKNQCYSQTIETLSVEINDLTEKCKYYENYIRDQEKLLSTQPTPTQPSPPGHTSQHHYEQMLTKKFSQLQHRQHTLLTIENELTFSDKKLKELQTKLSKQSSQIDKRERLCANKEEEIEKYLQQLNAREEELYVWEKQLNEEDKKLTRKANQLQRERAMLENQRVNSVQIVNPYQGAQQIIENRNGMTSSYPNQYPSHHYPTSPMMSKPLISPQQPALHAYHHTPSQPRMYYQRPQTYHPTYQPLYQDQPSIHNQQQASYFQKTHHNLSQQHLRYQQFNNNDSEELIRGPEHGNVLDHSDLDISELKENRISQKQKTESMRVRPAAELNHSIGENGYSKVSQYRPGVEKLYLSSTYQKKSEMVEEILAKRRHHDNISHRQQRPESRSPISVRTPLNDMFKKSQASRIKSPLKNDSSFHTLKDVTERKLRERYEKKQMFQKPSKDMSDGYRPSGLQGSGGTMSPLNGFKKYPYDGGREVGNILPERQYTPRSFMKSSVPGALNINEKLEKLKEEIKRQVRDLE